MPPESIALHIAVLGRVPELETPTTASRFESLHQSVELHHYTEPRPISQVFGKEVISAVIAEPDWSNDGFGDLIDRILSRDPFCRIIGIADATDASGLTEAGADRLDKTFVRPEDPDLSAQLLRRAIVRTLDPVDLVDPGQATSSPLKPWMEFATEGDGYFVIDSAYRIRDFNRRVNQLHRRSFGRDLDIGQSAYALLPAGDRASFAAHFSKALSGERTTIRKNISNVEDGESWHEYDLLPINSPEGEACGVGIVVRKASPPDDREMVLQGSEERVWSFFEDLEFGMVIANPRGRFIHANAAFQEFLGYTEMELQRRTVVDVTYEKDLADTQQAFQNLHDSRRQHIHLQKRYCRKDGELVWGDTVAWPVYNANGEFIYSIALIVDIDERMRMQEQLRRAEKMQAVGELASGFAHEFNNLLSAIAGFAHAAEQDCPTESPLCDDLDRIQDLAERGGLMTRQLLAYSRDQEPNPATVQINPIVENFAQMVGRLLDPNVDIELNLANGLPDIWIDPGHLEQVLMNLGLNARDAMPDGGTLTLTTHLQTERERSPNDSEHPELASGDYVVLDVADTGIGMDEETKSRIFEPFFSTKDVGEGTGLGLSLVYGVIQQFDGSIVVDSTPGEGTTFRIYLPAEQD